MPTCRWLCFQAGSCTLHCHKQALQADRDGRAYRICQRALRCEHRTALALARAVCMTGVVSRLQGYIDSLKSETNDYLEERYREGRDAVSLLERVRSGGSAADGGRKQQQQHSSSGGGILGSIFGGRKQETRCWLCTSVCKCCHPAQQCAAVGGARALLLSTANMS
jgi:hypothetical protein